MRSREEIIEERSRLLRGNRFLKDDVHRSADALIEKTDAHVKQQLSLAATTFLTAETPGRHTTHGAGLLDLAACWALTQPEFVKMIHAGIDQAAAPHPEHEWSPLSRAQLDKKVAALDKELVEIEREGKRAEILSRKAEVDAELQALEQD